MDAGDVYGSGSPTGIAFYENSALDAKWNGLLLSCEAALNTLLGYKPVPQGGTFKLERFDFVTTNPERKLEGIDGTAKPDPTFDKVAPSYFRPSDVTVGPDGAIYFCDWYDPRIGASAHGDASCSGTIYWVAPRGFKPVIPKFDITTTAGQIAALRSPALNVRYLGFRALKAQGTTAVPAVAALLKDRNPWIAARAVWLLPHLGDAGVKSCVCSVRKRKGGAAYRRLPGLASGRA